MVDLLDGTSWHPLVVHAVVVLPPLATLGTIAIALRPRWRVTYGLLVVLAAALGVALTPMATSSGQSLSRRVGNPSEHAELGDQLLWFAIPLLVLSAALVVLKRRARRGASESGGADPGGSESGGPATRSRLPTVVAALAVVAAVACSVQVYRIGDSGARAVWSDVPAAR